MNGALCWVEGAIRPLESHRSVWRINLINFVQFFDVKLVRRVHISFYLHINHTVVLRQTFQIRQRVLCVNRSDIELVPLMLSLLLVPALWLLFSIRHS